MHIDVKLRRKKIIGNELGNKICVGVVYARRSGKIFYNKVIEILVVRQTKLSFWSFRHAIGEKLGLTVDDGVKYLAACQILSEFSKNFS